MARLRLGRTTVAFCAVTAIAAAACQTLLDFDAHREKGDAGSTPSVRYTRAISITAPIGTPLEPGLSIRIPLDGLADAVAAGKLPRDYAGLQVFGPSGEVHRVVDTKPTFAADAVWIALAARIDAGATDRTYSLAYGGATARTPLADASRVFRLFDGFDSASLSPIWLTNGSPTSNRGVLVLRALQDEAITTRDGQVAATSVFEARVRVLPRETDAGPDTHYWLGLQRQGDFLPAPPWALWNSRTPRTIRPEVDESTAGPEQTQTADYRVYTIDRESRTTTFLLDGTARFAVDHVNDVALAPMVRNFGSANDVEIDWVRVHTRVSPEPLVTVGPEQPAP